MFYKTLQNYDFLVLSFTTLRDLFSVPTTEGYFHIFLDITDLFYMTILLFYMTKYNFTKPYTTTTFLKLSTRNSIRFIIYS